MQPRPTSYPPIGQRLSAEQIADKLAHYAAVRVDLLNQLDATSDPRKRWRIKEDLSWNSRATAAIIAARDRPVYSDEHDFAQMGKAS